MDGTHGDLTNDMIPVAVIDQANNLVFIFRIDKQEESGGITDIITADGTGFVVAKVGSLTALLEMENDNTSGFGDEMENLLLKTKKDYFGVRFMDSLLGTSWKQLIFSVSIIFVSNEMLHN